MIWHFTIYCRKHWELPLKMTLGSLESLIRKTRDMFNYLNYIYFDHENCYSILYYNLFYYSEDKMNAKQFADYCSML